jgi:hypothetical protein
MTINAKTAEAAEKKSLKTLSVLLRALRCIFSQALKGCATSD